MILLKKIPFKNEDKNYEIRILHDDTTINVVTFFDNHPANGIRHQIIFPKNSNIKKFLENGAGSHLIELSKNDIIEKQWEKIKS